MAPLVSPGAAPALMPGAIAGAQRFFWRAGDDFGEIVGESLQFDLGEFSRDGEELVAQVAIEKPNDEMARADLGIRRT